MSAPPTTASGTHFTSLSSSPLRTRDEFAQACASLLEPLLPFFSPGCTRIRIGATATRFDESAAQLEGFSEYHLLLAQAGHESQLLFRSHSGLRNHQFGPFEFHPRSLWGLGALLATHSNNTTPSTFPFHTTWLTGLRHGTDPAHPEFWGWPEDLDQRMVEMCPLAFALFVAPQYLWAPLSETEKGNVERWLDAVNERQMPDTNWLWFRVMANLAMAVNGRGRVEVVGKEGVEGEGMKRDLDRLDSFYRGEGWSNDGPEGYTQMDYYSGSFAIQLLQLIYVKIRGGVDGVRAERYRGWAREFAVGLVGWFDEEGRTITFGRSLTYRFAMAGFWAAVAFADLELPAPLTWGVVKGLLLRNLRWWTRQKDILTPQGTLTIGYCYPNQFLSENYNSPGSPYWFMLSFIALACPETHPFWQAEEEPYPAAALPAVMVLKEPKHIVVRKGGHTFLLSSGQHCHYPMRAAESKYGKFAYSSAFGYSVPTGGYFLPAVGGDNTLALSDDGGESWKVKRVAIDARIEYRDGTPVLMSGWEPWNDVYVETILVPPTDENPNWHLRAHSIKTSRALLISEGAFALNGERKADGRMIRALDEDGNEGRGETTKQAIAVSSAGAVGIAELLGDRKGEVLDEDANSNLYVARSVLPTLSTKVKAGEQHWFIAGVFAVPSSAQDWQNIWREGWKEIPSAPQWLQHETARGS